MKTKALLLMMLLSIAACTTTPTGTIMAHISPDGKLVYTKLGDEEDRDPKEIADPEDEDVPMRKMGTQEMMVREMPEREMSLREIDPPEFSDKEFDEKTFKNLEFSDRELDIPEMPETDNDKE